MEETGKYRALFVDDDENILNGLKRVLRPLRRTWDLQFVTSGYEALQLLERDPYDLLVSDMRMPGMDGAELLEKVRTASPQTVRIILSGHSEQEAVLKTVKHAHQFQSKPTNPDDIKSLMDRVIMLQTLLRNQNIRKLVSSIETLPSLPGYHVRLMEMIESDQASFEDIADLISKDIGMSTNVLKLVNSAFFGHPKRITELSEAVWWLGLELLKALALTTGLFTVFKAPPTLASFLDNMMQHSLGVAILARNIVFEETRDKGEADLAFLGGLLHDLGKLALAYIDPEKFSNILPIAKSQNLTVSEIEKDQFGASHAEVGGYLAGLWGMNLSTVEALAYHHNPSETQTQGFSVLMAVHVANSLDHEMFSYGNIATTNQIDMDYLEKQGYSDKVPVWRALVPDLAPEG